MVGPSEMRQRDGDRGMEDGIVRKHDAGYEVPPVKNATALATGQRGIAVHLSSFQGRWRRKKGEAHNKSVLCRSELCVRVAGEVTHDAVYAGRDP